MKYKLFQWFINPVLRIVFLLPVFAKHIWGGAYLSNYVTLYAWALFFYMFVYGLVVMCGHSDWKKLKEDELRSIEALMNRPKILNILYRYTYLIATFLMALIGEWPIFVYSIAIIFQSILAAEKRNKIWKDYKASNVHDGLTDAISSANNHSSKIEDAEFTEIKD